MFVPGIFARIDEGRESEERMLDRLKIETILTRRFPGATLAQVAAATNAIMGLDDETITTEIATPDTSDSEPAMTRTPTYFKTNAGRALGLLLGVSGVFLHGWS